MRRRELVELTLCKSCLTDGYKSEERCRQIGRTMPFFEWANPENLKLRTLTPVQETTDRKTEHEIGKRLTRVLLPGFQEELERLPGNLNLSVHTIGSSWWHEEGLWSLLEIDDVIREIERSINTQHQIRLQFFEYLQDHFRPLILECLTFFEDFSFEGLSSAIHDFTFSKLLLAIQNHPITHRWETISKLITSAIQELDVLIRSLQGNLLVLAKYECQLMVYEIEDNLNSLLENSHSLYQKYHRKITRKPISNSQRDELLNDRRKLKYIKLAGPILKLCRLFYNNLFRETNRSQRIIFNEPMIMRIGDTELNEFLVKTDYAKSWLSRFRKQIEDGPRERRKVGNMTINVQEAWVDSWTVIVEQYVDCLVANNDPQVDQKIAKDARKWLQSWVIEQCTSAMNFVRWIPGPEHPSPGIDHTAEVAQSSLAASNGNEPISNEQLAASSLLPMAEANSGRPIGQQGEHCIAITSESTTTPGQIQSSHNSPVTRLDFSSEMDHQGGILNQESISTQPEPRQGDADIIECILDVYQALIVKLAL
ncbi:hypothetical protein PSHT_05441 [Puccinia striiformis]|uniref:Uncharacterized protein n=1 Tax=Puccinia striiformis TaxID=27350 RepID=A0A2S4WAB5_9BASI|nr:hypothetical protein PSHT_05441 [Puccinia striiformis]